MKKRLSLGFLFGFSTLTASTVAGHAGVLSFVHACVENVTDLSQLPAHLQASGMKEVDAAKGPRSPVGSGSPQQQRLWQQMPAPPETIDAFTGYSVDNVGFPAEICFHVSRPGEPAAVALRELKNRFPPIGESWSGAYFSYGGMEHWEVRINGVTAIMGVVWPNKDQPDEGSSQLYLIKRRDNAPKRAASQ